MTVTVRYVTSGAVGALVQGAQQTAYSLADGQPHKIQSIDILQRPGTWEVTVIVDLEPADT